MKIRTSILSVAFLLVVFSLSALAEPVVMRLAENQPDNNPVTHADLYLAELVKEATGGEVMIEVYSGAVLGQETESIQQTRAGIIEMARVNSVPLADFIKELGVVTLPYVFVSPEHQYKVVSGEIGEEIAKAFENVGLKLICWFHAGSRNFYTVNKPIKCVADVKGMKLRVQPSKISIKMVELMGGVPTPMNYSDVYSALQTGVIDGAENDYVSYYTSSHYEVATHYTEDGHLAPPAVVIMNKDKFDVLKPEHQKILLESGRKAMDFEYEKMIAFNNESKEKVLAAGSQVYAVDAAEFQEAVAPIYDEFPQFGEVLKRIRALQ